MCVYNDHTPRSTTHHTPTPLDPTPTQVSPQDAAARIAATGETYKQEILDDIVSRDPSAPITIYHIGETDHPDHWWDLCAGPHVPTTRAIDPKAIQLETVAGAYWRGDEKRQQLQRIYGTAWENGQQLQAYLTMKEEAARRYEERGDM